MSVRRGVEAPLEKVDISGRSISTLQCVGGVLDVTTAVFGRGTWEWQNELWMFSRCEMYAIVSL